MEGNQYVLTWESGMSLTLKINKWKLERLVDLTKVTQLEFIFLYYILKYFKIYSY